MYFFTKMILTLRVTIPIIADMKATIIIASSFLAAALFFGGCTISTLNTEASLRVAIEAKITANTAEFDNMKKKISGVAEVSSEAMDKLKEIFVSYADARTTDGGGLAKWVTESVPNIDASMYKQLVNTLTASRDSWTARQSELVDLSREQKGMFAKFPDNVILSIFGRKPTDIVVVTSSATKEAFRSGEDNDSSVFRKD